MQTNGYNIIWYLKKNGYFPHLLVHYVLEKWNCKTGQLLLFRGWETALCPPPSRGNLSAGVGNVPIIDATGPEQFSRPHSNSDHCPWENVREKPMLGKEATATLSFHMLTPLHVVCAFVTVQAEAAHTLPFIPRQCGRSICVSRKPFPLPHISLVQDFVKLSRNILELAGMHRVWTLYRWVHR